METLVEDEVPCCYALQDKVWVTDPDGARWEVYTVLGDSDIGTPGQQVAVPDASRQAVPVRLGTNER